MGIARASSIPGIAWHCTSGIPTRINVAVLKKLAALHDLFWALTLEVYVCYNMCVIDSLTVFQASTSLAYSGLLMNLYIALYGCVAPSLLAEYKLISDILDARFKDTSIFTPQVIAVELQKNELSTINHHMILP